MELSIILSLLLISGIFILKKSYKFENLGMILSLLSGIYLFLHIIFWSLSSYEYGKFVTKRESFVETLKYAREKDDKIELTSIVSDVSKWNQELASYKYDNETFLLKNYVDDRITKLKPIR